MDFNGYMYEMLGVLYEDFTLENRSDQIRTNLCLSIIFIQSCSTLFFVFI